MFKIIFKKLKDFLWNVASFLKIIFLWQLLNLIFLHYKYKKIKERNEIIFICCFQMGETYMLCSLLEHMRPKNRDKKFSLILKGSHKDIPGFFPGRAHRIFIEKKMDCVNFEENKFYWKYLAKDFIFPIDATFLLKNQIFNSNKYDFREIRDSWPIIKLYKVALGLAADCPAEKPKISQNVYQKVYSRLESMGVERGRAAMLFPEAGSTFWRDPDFWNKVSIGLAESGLKVYYSAVKNKFNIRGAQPISLSLAEIIPACEYFGHVIALRSGVCDIFSSAKCQMHILWPSKNYWIFYGRPGEWSLRHLRPNIDMHEYHVCESARQNLTVAGQVILNIRKSLGNV